MNDVLLIRRINPDQEIEEDLKMTFVLSGMGDEATCESLMKTLSSLDYIDIKDVILKYNGCEIRVSHAKIPDLIEEIAKTDIKIYGVYCLYD